MTAVQKNVFMITYITRFWMRKYDQKLEPAVKYFAIYQSKVKAKNPPHLSLEKISTLFYNIKDFPTLYEHLSRVGIDHTFTCLLQWKGHILPHSYLAYKEVGISHKLTRSFHCSDAQNRRGRPTICKLRKTEQLQYF